MTIKKGDVVLVAGKNIGYILSGGRTVDIVFYDSESKKYKIIKDYGNITRLQLLEHSTMGPELKARYDEDFKALKKGQYVKFLDHQGKEQKGYVEKGGTTVKVIFDNAKYQTTGPASVFTAIDSIVEPEPVSEMDKWTLVGFKEHRSMSEETMCFESFVAYNGEKVIRIKNSGQGESNRISPVKYDETSKDFVAQFDADLKSWIAQNGSKCYMEVEALWIDWIMFHQKLGVTAKAYLDKVQKDEDAEIARWERLPS